MNPSSNSTRGTARTIVCIHTTGIIRCIESGFMGHLNDAQTFGLMPRIGTELCFPEQCVLLGDKIYPNGNCIMTPYTAAQLAR